MSIYLKRIYTKAPIVGDKYPCHLPIFHQKIFDLSFANQVTILVGENGTGKSTILEAIALNANFNVYGGNKNHQYGKEEHEISPLLNQLTFAWNHRIAKGFFLRAESFFQFATYIEENRDLLVRYDKNLNHLSHGEAFLEMFKTFKDGIFILDEPEAALSPARQLIFMRLLHEITKKYQAQFIIATHSPILMMYPDADVLYIQDGNIKKTDCLEIEHYQITKSILNNKESFFKYLFEEE